ncbi:DUF192 domain-containing protein [Microvirga brassicacearum]|uniref:DUF192 domain-containing protein n=1 Tax=Microvirga brassicacearum TaxID=2580413 RepID=A0A5N3P975_9HYPH|nr:DUF192 domain-containing protein [Microvirga brassicacearum]KAB0266294.1 DUF192 domain-containing protein [Microvirga brassicacearum]
MRTGLSGRFASVAAAAGLLILALGAAAGAQSLETLSIVTQGGQRQSFRVEVARNDADRAQGLMFRRAMPADHGMLFDFEKVAPVNMWMQNTYLSLDMLFVRADGTIARIAANTEPLSTRTIPSGEPVLAVLELNAGTAGRLAIKAGDRIEHPLFKR